jgi:hypothetical protein
MGSQLFAGFKGYCINLTLETNIWISKQFLPQFRTVPPAIALWIYNRCWNSFADFSKTGIFADFLWRNELHVLLAYCPGRDAVSEMFGRFGGDSGPGSGQQHTGSILSKKNPPPPPILPTLMEMEKRAKASVVDPEWFSRIQILPYFSGRSRSGTYLINQTNKIICKF